MNGSKPVEKLKIKRGVRVDSLDYNVSLLRTGPLRVRYLNDCCHLEAANSGVISFNNQNAVLFFTLHIKQIQKQFFAAVCCCCCCRYRIQKPKKKCIPIGLYKQSCLAAKGLK